MACVYIIGVFARKRSVCLTCLTFCVKAEVFVCLCVCARVWLCACSRIRGFVYVYGVHVFRALRRCIGSCLRAYALRLCILRSVMCVWLSASRNLSPRANFVLFSNIVLAHVPFKWRGAYL